MNSDIGQYHCMNFKTWCSFRMKCFINSFVFVIVILFDMRSELPINFSLFWVF